MIDTTYYPPTWTAPRYDSLTINCPQCGEQTIRDRQYIGCMTRVLDAFAVGAAPLVAMTCYRCNCDLRAADVTRPTVTPWLAGEETR